MHCAGQSRAGAGASAVVVHQQDGESAHATAKYEPDVPLRSGAASERHLPQLLRLQRHRRRVAHQSTRGVGGMAGTHHRGGYGYCCSRSLAGLEVHLPQRRPGQSPPPTIFLFTCFRRHWLHCSSNLLIVDDCCSACANYRLPMKRTGSSNIGGTLAPCNFSASVSEISSKQRCVILLKVRNRNEHQMELNQSLVCRWHDATIM